MKAVKIGIIIVCLVSAIAIIWGTWGGGGGSLDDISDADMTWVICRNNSCKAESEMGLKAYYKFISANANFMAPSLPAS